MLYRRYWNESFRLERKIIRLQEGINRTPTVFKQMRARKIINTTELTKWNFYVGTSLISICSITQVYVFFSEQGLIIKFWRVSKSIKIVYNFYGTSLAGNFKRSNPFFALGLFVSSWYLVVALLPHYRLTPF